MLEFGEDLGLAVAYADAGLGVEAVEELVLVAECAHVGKLLDFGVGDDFGGGDGGLVFALHGVPAVKNLGLDEEALSGVLGGFEGVEAKTQAADEAGFGDVGGLGGLVAGCPRGGNGCEGKAGIGHVEFQLQGEEGGEVFRDDDS